MLCNRIVIYIGTYTFYIFFLAHCYCEDILMKKNVQTIASIDLSSKGTMGLMKFLKLKFVLTCILHMYIKSRFILLEYKIISLKSLCYQRRNSFLNFLNYAIQHFLTSFCFCFSDSDQLIRHNRDVAVQRHHRSLPFPSQQPPPELQPPRRNQSVHESTTSRPRPNPNSVSRWVLFFVLRQQSSAICLHLVPII